MATPSDLAQRRLQAAKQETQTHYAALTALADEAAFLMHYYLERGYDTETALTLTDITLDRHDNQETI
ncbi:hypothetical protein ACL1EU_11685 [Corynebacterium striatum]